VADHVHLAIRLNRQVNVAGLVAEIKASSSKWLKSQSPKLAEFAWQRGYGAFSVEPADLNSLIRYIDAQASHHAKQNFQGELRAFLKRYGIECEERYLWD
jgi:REP element-mobilizing transposase RayT